MSSDQHLSSSVGRLVPWQQYKMKAVSLLFINFKEGGDIGLLITHVPKDL